MDTIISKAQTRISEISAEIQSLSQKKAELEQFVSTYKMLASETTASPSSPKPLPLPDTFIPPPLPPIPPYRIENNVPLPMTMKDKIIGTAGLLARQKSCVSTREIVSKVEAENMTITGYDKYQTVSSILSRSGFFKSDRKLGWSLKTKTPESVSADSGVDSQLVL